jgi:hypothetical protein
MPTVPSLNRGLGSAVATRGRHSLPQRVLVSLVLLRSRRSAHVPARHATPGTPTSFARSVNDTLGHSASPPRSRHATGGARRDPDMPLAAPAAISVGVDAYRLIGLIPQQRAGPAGECAVATVRRDARAKQRVLVLLRSRRSAHVGRKARNPGNPHVVRTKRERHTRTQRKPAAIPTCHWRPGGARSDPD